MKNFIRLFSLTCILIVLSTCKKESKQNPETDYIIYDNGEGSIGAGGGKITLKENNQQESSISIDIPAGALTKAEFISIDVSSNALSNSSYSLGSIIELKPAGIKFNDSVILTIKLNSSLNQNDYPIIFQYLPKRGYLKYNETSIDSINNYIYTYINHFSLWTYTLRHPDLRDLLVQNFQVYIDDYPSKPVQSYENIAALTKEDIMRAFSQWDYYTGKSFSLSTNVDEANIAVQFGTATDADDFFGGDPLAGGASAVALWYLGDLTERVILFNDDFTWASTEYIANNAKGLIGSNINAEGVEFTALHEIGHLFGVQHYQTQHNSNAVMTPYSPSLFPRVLTCTDLSAFSNQYSNSCAVSLNSLGDLNIVAEPGSTIQGAIMAKVTDANGNAVPGITVLFFNDSNVPMEYTRYNSTNSDGVAYMSSMTVPQYVGKINMIAYAYLSDKMKSLTYTIDIKEIEDPGSLSDTDGNIYKTVKIGTQVWMKENLKTTKYNDGTEIPLVTSNSEWGTLSTPAMCWYNNGEPLWDFDDNPILIKETYGALYNWYTINTGKLCPDGWHVPSDDEWSTLTYYLTNNGYGYGGSGNDIAKSMASTSDWFVNTEVGGVGNNQAINNSSGFTGVPGGNRNFIDGSYSSNGFYACWWSANATIRDLTCYNSGVGYGPKQEQEGMSVRCLKDN